MHEVHVAQSVLNIAVHEAEHHAAKRVRSIHVIIGKFSCVNPASLSFCFDVVSRGTIAQGARLEVTRDRAAVTCFRCQTALTTVDNSLFCPHCGEPTEEIMAGQDMGVDSLEVEI